MIISIGNYRIISNDRQFQLVEVTSVNEKTGADNIRRHGYFMSLDELLKKLFKLQVVGDEINSLIALNNTLNTFIMQVSQAVTVYDKNS